MTTAIAQERQAVTIAAYALSTLVAVFCLGNAFELAFIDYSAMSNAHQDGGSAFVRLLASVGATGAVFPLLLLAAAAVLSVYRLRAAAARFAVPVVAGALGWYYVAAVVSNAVAAGLAGYVNSLNGFLAWLGIGA